MQTAGSPALAVQRWAALGCPTDQTRAAAVLSGTAKRVGLEGAIGAVAASVDTGTALHAVRLLLNRAKALPWASALKLYKRPALEKLLLEYTGTVLLASHDRRLLETVATRRILVQDTKLLEQN